jgi:hypothetical protein
MKDWFIVELIQKDLITIVDAFRHRNKECYEGRNFTQKHNKAYLGVNN